MVVPLPQLHAGNFEAEEMQQQQQLGFVSLTVEPLLVVITHPSLPRKK